MAGKGEGQGEITAHTYVQAAAAQHVYVRACEKKKPLAGIQVKTCYTTLGEGGGEKETKNSSRIGSQFLELEGKGRNSQQNGKIMF